MMKTVHPGIINSGIKKYSASCTEYYCFDVQAFAIAFNFAKSYFPQMKVALAVCFMTSDVSSSPFKKQAHIYVTRL